jgi:hypothetical protein
MIPLNPILTFMALTAYAISRATYFLFLSPLAKFPGPSLAAVSRLYELYYDGFQSEGYIQKLRDLHKQYGNNTESSDPLQSLT